MSTTPESVFQMVVAIEIASAKWVAASTRSGDNKIRRTSLTRPAHHELSAEAEAEAEALGGRVRCACPG